MNDEMTETSKLIAYMLRHRPNEFGLSMDQHGWVDANEVVKAVAARHKFDAKMLEAIVASDEKKRYSFNEDKSKIRANQGHSIQVDVEMPERIPPEVLYHGTGEKYVEQILKSGLLPKSRLHVHLSKDHDTAVSVGSRHGKPAVFEVRAKAMHDAGHKFWLSENEVWLTKAVPVEFMHLID